MALPRSILGEVSEFNEYCTILIDLAVTHHRACGLGQIQSPVLSHNPHGQKLLANPKNGQKRLFKQYLQLWVVLNVLYFFIFKVGHWMDLMSGLLHIHWASAFTVSIGGDSKWKISSMLSEFSKL